MKGRETGKEDEVKMLTSSSFHSIVPCVCHIILKGKWAILRVVWFGRRPSGWGASGFEGFQSIKYVLNL